LIWDAVVGELGFVGLEKEHGIVEKMILEEGKTNQ
jgi:hypothetical protein